MPPTAPAPPSRAGCRYRPGAGPAGGRPGRAPSCTAKALGRRNGSKPCRLRPVGSTSVVRSRSPPGRADVAAIQRPQHRRDLVILGQQRIQPVALRPRRDGGGVKRLRPLRGVGRLATICSPCGISVYSARSAMRRSAAPRVRIGPGGLAADSSTAAACACSSPASAAVCSASASGSSARQRSSVAFRSSSPRYSPACATGGVR